jgi:hypothetical protein
MKLHDLHGYDRKIASILMAASSPKTTVAIAEEASRLCGFHVNYTSVVGAFAGGYLTRKDRLYWNPDLCSQVGERKTPKKYYPISVAGITA